MTRQEFMARLAAMAVPARFYSPTQHIRVETRLHIDGRELARHVSRRPKGHS